MFTNIHNLLILACVAPALCFLLTIQSAHSADIAYEVRQAGDTSLFLEVGMQVAAVDLPIVGWASDNPDNPTSLVLELNLALDARAEWKGLFAESFSESFTGWALGYSPWENPHTRLDLVLTEGLGAYEPGIGAFESVENRDPDLVAGIRTTHTFNSSLVQLEIYSDISGEHDGQIAALQAGRYWQIRNWNLHGVIGARYFSDKLLDHYFGISEEESTATIPRYQSPSGTLATIEVGATLPLSEKWLFKSSAQGIYLPDAVSKSPLADGRIGTILAAAINYVF